MSNAWLSTDDDAFDFLGMSAGSMQQDHGDEPWYQVLGVERTCTNDEIKSAFKREIKAYHSDRVANLGIRLREVAEAQSKKINAAYKTARRERGMP